MYSSEKIASVVKGTFLLQNDNTAIEHLLIDSRKIIFPESSLFFAIKSPRNDGHKYLHEVYEKGVRNFVVSEKVDAKKLPKATIIQIENTVRALQQLTAFHRQQFQLPIIGITGSNGKTIVKEWLYQLLEKDFNIVRSPKSYNSQIGVPLSVWQIKPENTLGIFEAGISQTGEMEFLEKIIHPTIGILTNIGQAHDEGFLNVRQKTNEKLILFSDTEILIYCKDYHEINECITNIKSQIKKNDPESKRFSVFTWSKNSAADLQIKKISKQINNTEIEAIFNGENISISIPFSDDASIENAIHCWALMLYLKYSPPIINERMHLLGKIAMRLELKAGINNCSIINDSYNSDFSSLSIALDFLNQQKQHEKRTVILSDILQSGKDEKNLYSEVAQMIESKGVNNLIGIGKAILKQKKEFASNSNLSAEFFENTDDFLKNISSFSFKDETILLKGARPFEFERIGKFLEQKIHETVLEINLNALAHNLNVYRSILKPSTKIMAMVKAFSYGSGSFEIANQLQFQRVDYLGVAYADEGVELRKRGITLPIMVMNPELRSFETMITYKLEPEIYSLSLLEKFSETVSLSADKSILPFPIHLELETGMNRLGFEEDDLEILIEKTKNNSLVKIQSVFSHLVGSDESKLDDFTQKQIEKFEKMSKKIIQQLKYPVLRHILNSSGISRFPKTQMEMVRLGIGLYGIAGLAMKNRLQNVSTLKTTVSQIKIISAKESVGYNRMCVAKKEMKIATVAIGYADGLSRRLSNGNGKMLVNGKLVPIVGNVCMDMCMLDVTEINEITEGDEVIVFGENPTIHDLAKWAETIPYEILTGISQRVKRVYYQE